MNSFPDSNAPEPDDLFGGATLRGFRSGQRVFGRFELLLRLGGGGMGEVWAAWDSRLDREVALKFLPEALRRDPGALKDLRRETQRALELTHPNIVRIHDYLEDPVHAAISMELIPGQTLGALRASRSGDVLEGDDLRPWLPQLASALDYAHATARMVHRDLKPSNLMLTTDGTLKIADFGVAQTLRESATRLTFQGSVSGTLPYMSLQQLSGQRPEVSDDIYSLGATLYELLAGKPPFFRGDVAIQIREAKPVMIRERRAELGIEGQPVPEAWEEALAACLEKDPSKRPRSAGALVDRLLNGSSAVPRASATAIDDLGADQFSNPAPAGSMPAPTHPTSGGRGFRVLAVVAGIVVTGSFWVLRSKFLSPTPAWSPIASSTQSTPYTNSLGMRFVPVEVGGGKSVLFSVWETRVKDYAAYANAVSGVDWSWREPEVAGKKVTPTEDCPVVNVSWEDAKAYAKWLTERERKEGRILEGSQYRLPTDEEWSWAVGIGGREGEGSPEEKNGGLKELYPWGHAWPPPDGAGNYDDETSADEQVIDGFKDGFDRTSSVGSFRANASGLYDLGGNVWEWCEDYSNGMNGDRVLRGGSWFFCDPILLLSSVRVSGSADSRVVGGGFRLVLVGAPGR